MGKQAKINEIAKHIAAKAASNGKARDLPTYQLPLAVIRRLAALQAAAINAQGRFQTAVDVACETLGVDLELYTANIENNGVVNVKPKGNSNAQSQESAPGGIPDVEELAVEAEPES
mgnify:CR=1 FL=1